ncbi:MAG: uroporphyrinogen-III C-methyltransferase [Gammaproteobacteria bacterium]|nr:uroporphyrinogen-III C-methyltransferase [Gammaproteobacteria bacterium]
MKFLPIFFDIVDRPCLVVGGGEVAARKVRQLLRSQGRVRVLAPSLCVTLQTWLEEEKIEHIAGKFAANALEDCVLVIAATNDRSVNENVSRQAKLRNLPVNVVDDPALCTFITPSVVDRDPIQIAISSGGASPVLARLLRARLETMIPSAYGRLATLMRDFREKARQRFPSITDRRRFWEQILQGPVAEMLFAGQDTAALKSLEEKLDDPNSQPDQSGEVYLVGGGPGDPDLLTFRALRLMQKAEVILYDRLVAREILELCRKDAERIYVGKKKDQHAVAQEDINQLLVDHARAGKRVLRLKGGDPFIFGRGGEEIDTLMEEGITFQVVPGITAASGCAAYAGIPLTHRDYAQSCIFITGHMKDGLLELNWDVLAQEQQTIAVYMGINGVEHLCRKLIEHGLSGTTPVALIRQGTRPEQKTFISDLSALPALIASEEISPPSMLIIGEVVNLHHKLSWFKET